MTTIYNASITTAQALAVSLFLQGSFAYGGSGSTVDCYVQTSLDGSATWWDIARFAFTNANKRRGFNLSALTPVTAIATPQVQALAADTSVDGLIGNFMRVAMVTTGTYTAPTVVQIDAFCDLQITPLQQL
jgi:hypothetical protein